MLWHVAHLVCQLLLSLTYFHDDDASTQMNVSWLFIWLCCYYYILCCIYPDILCISMDMDGGHRVISNLSKAWINLHFILIQMSECWIKMLGVSYDKISKKGTLICTIFYLYIFIYFCDMWYILYVYFAHSVVCLIQ